MDYVIAQVNIARLVAPLDSPRVADFVAGLEPVNAAADGAPGFVWRLKDDLGDATARRGFADDTVGAPGGVIINMSVWESVADLAAFVYDTTHRAVLRRRREWFEQMKDAYAALWWVPRGHEPTIGEAEERVRHLRAHGPTPHAFTLKLHFPPPSEGEATPVHGPEHWACPV